MVHMQSSPKEACTSNPGNTSNINNTYTIKGDIIGTKYILTYNKKLKDNILFVTEDLVIWSQRKEKLKNVDKRRN